VVYQFKFIPAKTSLMNFPDAGKMLEYLISLLYLLSDCLEIIIGNIIFPSLVLTNEALKPSYHSLLSFFPEQVAEFLGNLSPLALFVESIILTYLIFFLWLAYCTRNDPCYPYQYRIDEGAEGPSAPKKKTTHVSCTGKE
jgi:hypothetical protein